jgi:short-subunit dehydrogenase
MDLHLRGKRVLITGASKGIGAAAAEAFAEEGSSVHLAARSTEAMEALAQRLRAAHQVNVIAHTGDLRKSDNLHRLARETEGIDILVNNAGDIPGGSLDKIDEATWRHPWELKVFGYINLTRLVHADMKSRNHGVIVNIIGAAGERFNYHYITGSAGNAALMAFTKSLGGEGHWLQPGHPPELFVSLRGNSCSLPRSMQTSLLFNQVEHRLGVVFACIAKLWSSLSYKGARSSRAWLC